VVPAAVAEKAELARRVTVLFSAIILLT